MMDQLREFLAGLETWQIWFIGGVVAEVLLQCVKKYVWRPAIWSDKIKKLVAAAIVALMLALIPGWEGVGAYLASALGIFCAAVGYHETTDKTGLKSLWRRIMS